MKKIYYLSSCDTCKRILKDIDAPLSYERQDIKKDPVSSEELEELRNRTTSYEALFNKRARLYKERRLKDKDLSEGDIKNLILEHYTFLKRPVIVSDESIFIGNSKKTVAEVKKGIHE